MSQSEHTQKGHLVEVSQSGFSSLKFIKPDDNAFNKP